MPSKAKLSAHGLYRIDYLFANDAFLSRVFRPTSAQVCSEAEGSDHCPVLVGGDLPTAPGSSNASKL